MTARGHQWLELDIPSAHGKVETYCLDASANNQEGGFVIKLSEAEAKAKSDPNGPLALYYANPDRTVVSD